MKASYSEYLIFFFRKRSLLVLQRRQSLFREVCKVCLTWCEQHPLEKATFSPAPACGARRVPATCSPAPPRSVAVKPLVPQAPDARWSPLLLTGSSFHITVQVFLRGVCLSEASLSAKQEESADWGRGAGGCRGAGGAGGCRPPGWGRREGPRSLLQARHTLVPFVTGL